MTTARANLLILTAALSLTACGVGTEEITVDESGEAMVDEAALTANSRIETFTGRDGRYYFHVLAGNGEKVLQSQGYSYTSSRSSGITSVKNNGVNEGRYFLREATDGAWYFVLVATNGTIIGTSEMYATQYNANRAIGTVTNVIRNIVAQDPAAQGTTKIEIFQGLDAKYYFHLRANNGEIVLQSQGYTSRTGASSGATSVQNNGISSSRYTVLPAADGKYYFVLKATNGQIIGRGETYDSQSNAQRGVTNCVDVLSGPVQR
jgi:uncharacterized protein